MIIKLIILRHLTQTSSYLDDHLIIDNPYFEGVVNQIYPHGLQLDKAKTSDIEVPILDLHQLVSISNGFVSSKMYDKRDYFDFYIYGW